MARVRKRSWKNKQGNLSTVWVCDWANERGGRHRKQFRIKRDADAFRIQIENQLQTGTYRSRALEITLNGLADLYLVRCQEHMERGERMTRHNLVVYRGLINNYILNTKAGVGTVKLAQVTAASIADFQDRLRSNDVSISTTRKVLSA